VSEEPKPHVWCGCTLFFAWLAVQLSGSWWQVPALTMLAVSGGTWAVDNLLWTRMREAQGKSTNLLMPLPKPRPRSGGYPTVLGPLPAAPAPPGYKKLSDTKFGISGHIIIAPDKPKGPVH
jgi:hypothetical protein